MQAIVSGLVFLSVLFPSKGWFAPGQPLTVQVKADQAVTLMLTDFTGKAIPAAASADVEGGEKSVDIRVLFPAVSDAGTYLLYAVPKGKSLEQFLGTPLVISVRADKRRGAMAGPMVIRMEPLRYAVMETDFGPLTLAFYYDVAPNTVANFLSLAEDGFYDGLTFHRISPGFVLQGGDPRGNGSGGPGYCINAEFNDRPHKEGVLSMARNGDPRGEIPGAIRPEYANSASSQFFICLDYAKTQKLDNLYTAFGKVVEGMDAVKKMGAVPLSDPRAERPKDPPIIRKVTVKPVTAQNNPYRALAEELKAPAPQS